MDSHCDNQTSKVFRLHFADSGWKAARLWRYHAQAPFQI
jgi:hypothetical protein